MRGPQCLLVLVVITEQWKRLTITPTEIMYLSGKPFINDTPGCVSHTKSWLQFRRWQVDVLQNAHGFIFTTVLFTQHLWTLAIAIATFLLLVSSFLLPLYKQAESQAEIRCRNILYHERSRCWISTPGHVVRLSGRYL